ncbi:40S small subunit processome assembly factor 1 isoform X1 [Lampetra fluviatilis]
MSGGGSSSSYGDNEEVDEAEIEAIAPSLLDAVLSRIYDCGDNPARSTHSKGPAKKKQREALTDTSGSDSRPVAKTQVPVGKHSKGSRGNLKISGTTRGKGLRKSGGREPLPSHLRDLHQAALEEPKSPLHNYAPAGERKGAAAKNGAGSENEVGSEESGAGPGSQAKTGGKAIQLVVYEDPRKRKRQKEKPQVAKENGTNQTAEVANVPSSDQETGFSIEKARLEVHKFGLTGYSRERQRECERARAIRLGAKPPKPEYINYKELLNRKRQQKEEAEKRHREEAESGVFNKKKKGRRHVESKRGWHDDLGVEGMPGRFRGGALLLSKEDIRRIQTGRS